MTFLKHEFVFRWASETARTYGCRHCWTGEVVTYLHPLTRRRRDLARCPRGVPVTWRERLTGVYDCLAPEEDRYDEMPVSSIPVSPVWPKIPSEPQEMTCTSFDGMLDVWKDQGRTVCKWCGTSAPTSEVVLGNGWRVYTLPPDDDAMLQDVHLCSDECLAEIRGLVDGV